MSFVGDRSHHFDQRALRYLSHINSYTSVNLRVLHIFVGSSNSSKNHLSKIDASKFIQSMKNLTKLSFMDESRKLIGYWGNYDGHTSEREEAAKVFVYSAFRVCIIDEELIQLHQPISHCTQIPKIRKSSDIDEKLAQVNEQPVLDTCDSQINRHIFKTNLSQMKIVDRQLKPKYLLRSAPNITSLYIDWQEGLCEAPFGRFHNQWFSTMVHQDPDWKRLAKNLTKLDIVFPSQYDSAVYSLPVSDCGALIQSCPNLILLRLGGAGLFAGPIPLLLVLKTCNHLEKLILENSEIHFPRHLAQDIISCNVNRSLKLFHYLGDVGNIAHISRNVANFMPNLEELQLQPYAPRTFRFSGLLPSDVNELNVMKQLRNLSIPLAIHAFMMNMPEMVYILRNFQSVRNVTLSWGSSEENYTYSGNRILYMMRWLSNALVCENANINVQLCFSVHQDIYVREI